MKCIEVKLEKSAKHSLNTKPLLRKGAGGEEL